MTVRIKSTVVFACVVLSMLAARNGYAQGAKLRLDNLDRLSDKAKETVNVNLDESLVQQASAMGGADAKALEVLQGLRGVYVRTFEFDSPGAYTDNDVEAIRSQLKAPGWSRIVSVREKGELTEIYVWNEAPSAGAGGLAIIAAERQELTVVNLVGKVNLAQLGALSGTLGITKIGK
jgi:hypothetical protein